MLPLKSNIPTRRFPLITLLLVLTNCVAYLYVLFLGRMGWHYVYAWGAIPYEFTHFTNLPSYPELSFPLTLVSSMFMHGGLLHLVANMLYLWIFGANVEDCMGRGRFIFFYLLCGLIAAGSHILSSPNSKLPMVGASGAVSGVLGGYLLLYPRAKILTLLFFGFFMRLVEIPATLLLGLWIIIQLINSLQGSEGTGGGVAWLAHIGGFLAGLILIQFFYRKTSVY